MQQKQEERAKILNLQVSLTWLLSSVGGILMLLATLLWNVAGATYALNDLTKQVVALQKSVDTINAKSDVSKEFVYALQRKVDANEMRLGALEKERK